MRRIYICEAMPRFGYFFVLKFCDSDRSTYNMRVPFVFREGGHQASDNPANISVESRCTIEQRHLSFLRISYTCSVSVGLHPICGRFGWALAWDGG